MWLRSAKMAMAAVAGALAVVSGASAVEYPTTVQTTAGSIEGFVSQNSRVWRGVPYMQAERFGPPHSPVPWSTTLETKTQNPTCPQLPYVPFVPGLHMIVPPMDEDCMFATVYAPKSGPGDRTYPVMVMFHGDVHGSGSTGIDDKTGLSDTSEVVVVECDFRLGILSNVILPGMEAEMSNNWFKDQKQCVRWAAENVAAFGGDASRITIAGETTTAVDVMALLTDGNEIALTDGSIFKPENIWLKTPQTFGHLPVADVIASTSAWAKDAPRNCNQTASADILACLRALTWQEVTSLPASLTGFPFHATYGPGTAFDSQPMDYVFSGRYNKNVTVMVGHTNATGSIYGLAIPWYLSNFQVVTEFENLDPVTWQNLMYFYWVMRVGHSPAIFPGLMQIYGAMAMQPGWNYGKALAASVSEGLYDCVASDMMSVFSRDDVKQYNYLFTHTPDTPIAYYKDLEFDASYNGDSPFWYGKTSMSHPQYVAEFSSFEKDQFIPIAQDWLTSFIAGGNPGNGWKQHLENDTTGNHGVNSIGANSVDGTDMVAKRTYESRCEFWSAFTPGTNPGPAAKRFAAGEWDMDAIAERAGAMNAAWERENNK